jgi:hypothetical protein
MARDEAGARRLDDPADWNRVELELALKRSARVIPLLIDETRMPRASELPGTLGQLARINALKLRDDDWDSDVKRLTQAIGPHGRWSCMRYRVAMTVATVIAIGVAGHWWSRPPTRNKSQLRPNQRWSPAHRRRSGART